MRSIKLLDQRLDITSLDETFSLVKESVNKKKKNLFFALNINILLSLNSDKKFKKIHEKLAKIIFLDGVPLIWLAKIINNVDITRVAGTDLTEKILKDKSLKIFLLGTTDLVLKTAKTKYKSVCGIYSPPFDKEWMTSEKQKIVKLVNDSKANVLLVAVGPLKQEKWLANNFHKINCSVGIGVGSALDILVENKPRAPKFLKNNGFEWLWRLILEPKRLGKRYFFDFLNFLKLIVKYTFGNL